MTGSLLACRMSTRLLRWALLTGLAFAVPTLGPTIAEAQAVLAPQMLGFNTHLLGEQVLARQSHHERILKQDDGDVGRRREADAKFTFSRRFIEREARRDRRATVYRPSPSGTERDRSRRAVCPKAARRTHRR